MRTRLQAGCCDTQQSLLERSKHIGTSLRELFTTNFFSSIRLLQTFVNGWVVHYVQAVCVRCSTIGRLFCLGLFLYQLDTRAASLQQQYPSSHSFTLCFGSCPNLIHSLVQIYFYSSVIVCFYNILYDLTVQVGLLLFILP